jgi:hypothetical protein
MQMASPEDAAIRRMNEPPSALDTLLFVKRFLARSMPARMEPAAHARKIVESRPVENAANAAAEVTHRLYAGLDWMTAAARKVPRSDLRLAPGALAIGGAAGGDYALFRQDFG